ncbi:MAG: type II toxin-antitoxin system Phd/YefM family antitoxin [Acidobacteria bacterium]|nr:type II toxin-antitoxin system Phd/YefM family antitoxin [Acidobacteriota bacterium]
MIEVNIHEAKTHLSRLLAKVGEGEEVIIARAGEPVAKIVPFARLSRKRIAGTEKGRITIDRDFDAPADPLTFA